MITLEVSRTVERNIITFNIVNMLLFFIWKSYTAPWRQLPCLIYTIPALPSFARYSTYTHNTCGVFGARASNLPATRRWRVVLYENIVLALIGDASFRWRRRLTGTSRAVGCIVRRGDKGVRLPPTTAPFLSIVSSLYSHTHTHVIYYYYVVEMPTPCYLYTIY